MRVEDIPTLGVVASARKTALCDHEFFGEGFSRAPARLEAVNVTKDQFRAKQAAVKVVLEWSPCVVPPGKTLAELVAKAIEEAVAKEREECAKLADFWSSDAGLSPCHGEGNRFGQKVAGRGIADSIRVRGRQ